MKLTKREKKLINSFIGKRVTVCNNAYNSVFQARGILKKEKDSFVIREDDCYCCFEIAQIDSLGESYFEETGAMYFYLK